MKKVLHVITNFTLPGGAESMLIRLVKATPRNIDQTIVSLIDVSPQMRKRLPTHVRVVALGSSGSLSMLLISFNLIGYLRGSEVVYSWMYHANAIASIAKLIAMCKTPLIWGVRHSLDDFSGESMSTKIAIYIGKLVNFMPKKVIYCSRRAMSQHEEFGYNSPLKSHYIPNGYEFANTDDRTGTNASCLRFGAAGRYHDAKDYPTLFKALSPLLKSNPESKLLLCGIDMDSSNPKLIELMKEADIPVNQVEMFGLVRNMCEFYEKVDIFVLSSKTEGFPNVLAEAVAHGCVAFSTDAGDAEVILNHSSRISPIGDARELTSNIQNYLQLATVEQDAVNRVMIDYVRSSFTIDKIAQEYLAVLKT